VIRDVLLGVEDLRCLGLHGGYDPRVGVPGVRDTDAGAVVEVAFAIAGDQP
jgi:hypothetical protein